MKKICIRIASSVFGAIVLGGTVTSTTALAAEPAAETALAEYISATEPPEFDTPEQAAEAFKTTVSGGSFDKLAELLGLDVAKAKASPGVMETYADIQTGVKQKVSVEIEGVYKVIEIGDEEWPLPFPLVERDGKWAFDTHAGLEEIADRRVGENELLTIDTLRAYVDAQEEYAIEDQDSDGVLEYAQKLVSNDGQRDGLYWPADQGDGAESPAGPALADGDAVETAKAGLGYHGYRYRILTSQGENIAGGKYDYVINGNMIAGFGLVAWPVAYGISGVKTFVVNRNGIIYEADLGENTAAIGEKIRTFNPGDNWDVVEN